jgi:hypothetical protein
MKLRSILFKGAMVRAILDGTKGQTRRVAKPVHDGGVITGPAPGGGAVEAFGGGNWHSPSRMERRDCPYGQPGDQLWVRETFAKIDGQTQPWIETDYRATYTHGDRLGDSLGIKKRWTPAIHMPRDASRITLQVTGVRVERLNEISEVDALAEGISSVRTPEWDARHFPDWLKQFEQARAIGAKPPLGPMPSQAYAALWDEINGPGAWAANPWVWAITFKVIKP